MVKEEIIEGLKLAVSKGEPLEKAMATFYNSGYKKEDIEEAAASINQSFFSQVSQTKPALAPIPQSTPPVSPQQTGQKAAIPISSQGNLLKQPVKPLVSQQQPVIQNVSGYGIQPKKAKSSSTFVTVVLAFFLLLLLAALAALFIFRTQISNLLNGFWRIFF